MQKELNYKFRRGTTAWQSEDIRKLIIDESVTYITSAGTTAAPGEEAMDVS